MIQTVKIHIFLSSVNNGLHFSHASRDLLRECLSTAYAHETLCYRRIKRAKEADNEWKPLEDKGDRMWLNTSHKAEYGKPSGTVPLCWYPRWKLGRNCRAESVISRYQRAQCERLPLRANLYVSPVFRMSMKCAWTLGGLRVNGIKSENHDMLRLFFLNLVQILIFLILYLSLYFVKNYIQTDCTPLKKKTSICCTSASQKFRILRFFSVI